MGIYIKEMDMPKSCIECLLHGESACKAFTTIEPWTFKDDERAAFCPLTEVPGPKWIPCNERLPRTGDDILVTFSDGEVDIIISARPKAWVQYEEANNLIFPVAWMPLPKPYKGGENE